MGNSYPSIPLISNLFEGKRSGETLSFILSCHVLSKFLLDSAKAANVMGGISQPRKCGYYWIFRCLSHTCQFSARKTETTGNGGGHSMTHTVLFHDSLHVAKFRQSRGNITTGSVAVN